jgi:hypothetical protein
MNGSPWNVLHVISNHERRVAQHLVVRSIEHYRIRLSNALYSVAAFSGALGL